MPKRQHRNPSHRSRSLAIPFERLEERIVMAAELTAAEQLVNDLVIRAQSTWDGAPQVAVSNVNSVVAFAGKGPQDDAGVFAKLYDADGVTLRSSFQVNGTRNERQHSPVVASRPTGEFVVAWAGRGVGDQAGIFFQRYTAAGVPVGSETRANSTTGGVQDQPTLAMSADGAFAIAWHGVGDGDSSGVFLRRFAADGVPLGAEVRVNQTSNDDQSDPALATDAHGRTFVTWSSRHQDGSDWGVRGRLFDASGLALGDELGVNATTSQSQVRPRVAFSPTGEFVVAWNSYGQDGDGWGVYVRRFSANAVPLGEELRVNTATTGQQREVSLAVGSAGDSVATYTSGVPDGAGWETFAQQLTPEGAADGEPVKIHQATVGYASGHQQLAAAAVTSEGQAAVVYSGNGSVDHNGVYLAAVSVAAAVDLVAIDDRTIDELTTLALTASATTTSTGALTYWFDRAPEGATINPTTGAIAWTPTESQGPGVYPFIVVAQLSATRRDKEIFVVTVREVNQAPLLAPIGDKNVVEEQELTFTVSATDADLPAQRLVYRLGANAPTGATLDPVTGLFRWTPTEAQGPGDYPVTIIVSDHVTPEATDEETITIRVAEANRPPVLSEIADLSIPVAGTLVVALTATDPDLPANTLTFRPDVLPTGATLDATTGVIRWVPTEAQGYQTHTFTVTVLDNGTPQLSDTISFDVMVTSTNEPPTLSPIADATIDEEAPFSFTVTATDPNDDDLVFAFEGESHGATLDPTSGLFSWTPSESQGAGTYVFGVVVSDDGVPVLTDATVFVVTVREVNRSPVVTPLDNQTIDEELPFTLSVSATDPDLPANLLTYSLVTGMFPDGATINPSTGVINWTPSETQGPATYSFRVAVSDNASPAIVAIENFDVTVREVNRSPLLSDAPAQSVIQGSELAVVYTATDPDLPANDLTFSIVGDARGATVVPAVGRSADFRWAPDDTVTPGIYRFTIRVTDNGSPTLFDESTLSVEVHPIDCEFDESLTGWTVTENGGSPTGRGGVTSVDCQALLVEGDSFRVALEQSFVIPAGATSLSFEYAALAFDLTDPAFVNDAFEASLVDSTGASLVPTYSVTAGVDAYFNASEDVDIAYGSGVTVVGNVVTVSLAGIAAGTTATLRFRLANNDLDNGTSVRIRSVTLPAGAIPVLENSLPNRFVVDTTVDQSFRFVGAADQSSGEPAANAIRDEIADLPRSVPDQNPLGAIVFWHRDSFSQIPNSNQVMMAPAVIDVNGDSTPDIIFSTYIGSNFFTDGTLRAVSGDDGRELWSVTDPSYQVSGGASIAVGDLDNDGNVEIVAIHESATLIAFGADGSFKWKSNTTLQSSDPTAIWAGPSLADLDQDGTAEIIFGSQVFRSDGNLLWEQLLGRGDNGTGPLSAVVDLDLDSVPEIVAGNTAYHANGTVYWHAAPLSDGFVAIGNFNADRHPEIVVVSQGTVRLQNYLGDLLWGPVAIPGGGEGGAPTIADFDADGYPEIGVAAARSYSVFETDGTLKWSAATQDSSSRQTGSSVFDFDSDGQVEAVYGDEQFLRIYAGIDGQELFKLPKGSGTTYELPVIADADGNGTANIVAVANQLVGGEQTGLYMLGSADESWESTRPIWNQHSYHITNINDDGTIPRVELNSWELYNNYRRNLQVTGTQIFPPVISASAARSQSIVGQSVLVSGRAFADGELGNGAANRIVAVTVNGRAVDVLDARGQFFAAVDVLPGENRYIFGALDAAGQEATTSVIITGVNSTPEIDFSRYADITGSFSGVYGRTSFKDDADTLLVELATRNEGAFATGVPILVGVKNLRERGSQQPTVELIGADGVTPDGIPYFDFSDFVRGTAKRLAPGESTESPVIAFHNPNRVRFDYELVFYGKLNAAPEFTTVPDVEALVGKPYVYDASAIDPDGDTVTYRLVERPDSGMAINATTGVITWTPAANFVGDQTVIVEAADGRGGVAEQRYTLSVIPAPPNRPPVITSSPVTMAMVDSHVAGPPQPFDLSRWSVIQYDLGEQGAANWIFESGNTVVRQTNNSDASILLSDLILENSRVEGTWRVGTGNDDDFMGFVFGYEDISHYYLFDWKQTTQGDPLGTALLGMSIKRIDASPPLDGFDLWPTNGNPGRVTTLYHNDLGWQDNVDYQFILETQPGLFTISVQQGETHLGSVTIADDRYPRGKFGFYNYSQDSVFYNGFTQQTIPAQTYFYDIEAIDPDSDSLTYKLLTKPDGMFVNAQTGTVSWGPTVDQIGNHTVKVEVTDGRGGVTTQEFVVCVKGDPANHAPIISSDPITTAVIGTTYLYNVDALDPDLEQLTYSLVAGPLGIGIDAITGLVTWDTNGQVAGVNNVTVEVRDSHGGVDQQSFQITLKTPGSGEIRGTKWNDLNGNGLRDAISQQLPEIDPTEDAILLLTWNGQPNSVGPVLTAAGFEVIVGSLAPGQIASALGSREDINQVWVWTDLGAGIYSFSPADPTRNFSAADLEALQEFSDSHTQFIMDGLAFRDHDNAAEIGLSKNVAANLKSWGGGIVLGTDDGGPGSHLKQHVNQVANAFNFNPFEGIYFSTSQNLHEGGSLFSSPNSISLVNVSSTGSYSELPHGDQPNGRFLSTAIFASSATPFSGSDPSLENENFGGVVYASVNHLVTTTIPGGGIDPIREPGLANWTIYLDQNENGRRDVGEMSTVTDTNGDYAFTGLPAGTYTVREESQSGWRQTFPVGAGSTVIDLADDEVASGVDFGNVTITAGDNQNPEFTSTAPTSTPFGTLFRYDAVATDPENDLLSYDLVAAPTGMTLNRETGTLVWQPQESQLGEHDIVLRVEDGRGGIAVQRFTLTVVAPNTAPVFTSTPGAQAIHGKPFVYDIDIQDADGDLVTVSLEPGSVGTLAAIAVTGPNGEAQQTHYRLAWTPSGADLAAGKGTIKLRATDGHGGVTLQTVEVNVVATAANAAPMIVSAPRTVARPGVPYGYVVEATDANADPLTYSLDPAMRPAGMTISSEGVITWTPPANATGSHPVRVLVSDGVAETPQEFTITIASTLDNRAPVVVSNPSQTGREGKEYVYNAIASDADGDPVRWSLEAAPIGMSLKPETGAIRWTPRADQIGPHQVVLRATDPLGASTQQSFVIEVACTNTPPLILSTPPTQAAVGEVYFCAVRAVDPDGDALTLSLPVGPSGMTISPSGLIRWTPAAADQGQTRTVVVRADDGDGGFAIQEYKIEVTAATSLNRGPTITSSPRFSATLGEEYRYPVDATDPDGNTLTYSLPTKPAWLTINPATGLITGTPPSEEVAAVVVEVSDGTAKTTQGFAINVRANRAPTISSTAPLAATVGGVYRYSVKASDPDGDALTYALLAGPAGMTIDGFGRIVWNVPTDFTTGAPRTADVQILVSDPRGATAPQDFTLTVSPDTQAPTITLQVASGSRTYLSESQIDLGAAATITVFAYDNIGVTSIALTIDGQLVPLDANNSATIRADVLLDKQLVATARDAAGNVGTKNEVVRVIDPAAKTGNKPTVGDPTLPPRPTPTPGDATAPNVVISRPAINASVTAVTPIIGRIDDPEDNLWFWRAYAAPVDLVDLASLDLNDPDLRILATGTNEINNSEIAKFDPSGLANDPYALIVVAFDASGRGNVASTIVTVEGAVKLGQFRLEFSDLAIPLAGIPIEITRVYDTHDAAREGDFGYGWSLGVKDARIVEVAAQGEGGTFVPDVTKVYLTGPGGQRVGFTYKENFKVGTLFGPIYTPYFQADPGVYDTLTIDEPEVTRGGLLGALGGEGINPDAYTLTTAAGVKYRYRQSTGLENITDLNGNTVTFTDGGIKHSSGVEVTFTRDNRGRITEITAPDGQKLRYVYSAAGDLASFTSQAALTTTFAYRTKPAHYLDEIMDPLGRRAVKTEYDDQGRILRTIDAAGNVVEYDHSLDGFERVKDAAGNVTLHKYDQFGNVIEERRGEHTVALPGGGTQTAYDSIVRTRYIHERDGVTSPNRDKEWRVTQVFLDALGASVKETTTEYAYDTRGNVTKVTDTVGGQTLVREFAHDAKNNVTRVIDELGRQTNFTYDAAGNLREVVNAEGKKAATVFDSQGRVTSYADFSGNTTTFVYQGSNSQPSEIRNPGHTDAAPNVRKFEYNALGQTKKITDEEGIVTVYQYDAQGREIYQRVGQDAPVRSVYEGQNLYRRIVARSEVEAGATDLVTEYGYTATDLVQFEIDPLGAVTGYEYDANGNRTFLGRWNTKADYDADQAAKTASPATVFAGRFPQATFEHVFVYDRLGRVDYDYDSAGNRTQVIDRNGRKRTFAYDERNRQIGELWWQVDVGSGQEEVIRSFTWQYCTCGSISLATEYDGPAGASPILSQYAYKYDLLGRLLSVDNAGTKDMPHVILSYGYDANGNQTRVEDNLGVAVVSTYDAQNRLKTRAWDNKVGINPANAVDEVMVEFDYYKNGTQKELRRYDLDDATGAKTLVGRTRYGALDASGRVQTISHRDALDQAIAEYAYGFDKLGLVKSLGYNNRDDQYDFEVAYGYDDLGQLTGADYSGATTARGIYVDESYNYDRNGNRVASHLHGSGYVTGAGNRLLSDGTFNYAYDNDGNQIRKTEIATGEVTVFEYDYRNLMTRATRYSQAPESGGIILAESTNRYDIDGSRISFSTDGDGIGPTPLEETRVIHNGGDTWADFHANNSITFRYLLGTRVDQIIGRWQNDESATETIDWFLTTRLGTVQGLTNKNGTSLQHFHYASFGSLIGPSPKTTNRFLFTAREYDIGTQMYYYRARFYDPQEGRFVSRDPIAFAAGDSTLYRYVGNRPLSFSDPFGEVALLEGLNNLSLSIYVTASIRFAGLAARVPFLCAAIHIATLLYQIDELDKADVIWLPELQGLQEILGTLDDVCGTLPRPRDPFDEPLNYGDQGGLPSFPPR